MPDFPTHATPPAQLRPITGREAEMIRNKAGGYSFALTPWERLERFLIMGSESGSYRVGEDDLTLEGAQAVQLCLVMDGPETVRRAMRVYQGEAVPKWKPAVFALAVCSVHGAPKVKAMMRQAVARLRTAAHLLFFVQSCDQLGKWRRSLRAAVRAWFEARDPVKLAHQALKYRSRDGWALVDVMRMAHVPMRGDKAPIAQFLLGKPLAADAPSILREYEAMRRIATASDDPAAPLGAMAWATVLPREVMPTEVLAHPAYWALVAPKALPLEALLRNLATMSRLGVLSDPATLDAVARRLGDADELHRARIHPVQLLIAFLVYQAGGGGGRSAQEREALRFEPVPRVLEILERAFFKMLQGRPAVRRRIRVAVDVSTSMMQETLGTPMRCKEAAAAIGLAFYRSCAAAEIGLFNTRYPAARDGQAPYPFQVTRGSGLMDIVRQVERASGGTDCAAPIIEAQVGRRSFDAFVILSDGDSWAGRDHVAVAMDRYRKTVNPDAKLVLVSMTGAGTDLVDPLDRQALGVVGFDGSVLRVIEDFLAG